MSKDNFKEKIELLKQISIVDYCNKKGIQLTNSPTYPSLIEHDSWVIDVRNNSFRWNSQGISGDIIKFVQTYYDVDFKTAVKELSGSNIAELLRDPPKIFTVTANKSRDDNIIPLPRQKFELDEIDGTDGRMYAYLIQKRGLSKKTVDEFAYKKLISQDSKGNINFKFKDEDGKIHYTKKGTTDQPFTYIDWDADIRGFRFTKNKNLSNVEGLAIYEAPIDLMSYIDLYGSNIKTAYAAMNGVKYQSLLRNMQDYPNLKELYICVDNDDAGKNFIEKIKKLAQTESDFHNLKIYAVHPQHVKDWNDLLLAKKQGELQCTVIKQALPAPKMSGAQIRADPQKDLTVPPKREPPNLSPTKGVQEKIDVTKASQAINNSINRLNKNKKVEYSR